MGTFVKFKNVTKIYKTGDVNLFALNDVSFEIEKERLVLFQVNSVENYAFKYTGGMDTYLLTQRWLFCLARESLPSQAEDIDLYFL